MIPATKSMKPINATVQNTVQNTDNGGVSTILQAGSKGDAV